MGEIKVGDRIVLVEGIEESPTYPFLKAGLEGVVVHIHPSKDHQYSVEFKGRFIVDPDGYAGLAINPTYLFDRSEIELKDED
jgi:hypothetical protein